MSVFAPDSTLDLSLSATTPASQSPRSHADLRRLYRAGEVHAAFELASALRLVFPLDVDAVPILKATPSEVAVLPLQPGEARVLARIDGQTPIVDLLDDCDALPRDAVEALLGRLLAMGVLGLDSPSSEPAPRVA